MKSIKVFETEEELEKVKEHLERNNIYCDSGRDSLGQPTLYVYVGNFIKARDAIIDFLSSSNRQEKDNEIQ